MVLEGEWAGGSRLRLNDPRMPQIGIQTDHLV